VPPGGRSGHDREPELVGCPGGDRRILGSGPGEGAVTPRSLQKCGGGPTRPPEAETMRPVPQQSQSLRSPSISWPEKNRFVAGQPATHSDIN
jgi:hypothetical protein